MGAIGLANVVLAWSLAAVVFASRPDRAQNRALALLLALEGAYFIGGAGIIYVTDDPQIAFASQALTEFFAPAVTIAYLLFVSTLETPLARPLRSRPVTILLRGAMVALPVFVLFNMDLMVTGVAPESYSLWEGVSGPWNQPSDNVRALVVLVGVAFAADAWRRARKGTAARSRAAAYMIAFGIRDAVILVGLVLSLIAAAAFERQVGFQAPLSLYYLMLGHGILRHQLFDIDLKIRWTVKQSTIAAAFVAVFFIVSEAAQVAFQSSLGPLAGIVAAGALVFFLAPLQRVADRVASAAVPGAKDSDEYRTVRKREVYRAALDEALVDGRLSEKDRNVLAALADQLRISNMEAREMEREAAPRGVA